MVCAYGTVTAAGEMQVKSLSKINPCFKSLCHEVIIIYRLAAGDENVFETGRPQHLLRQYYRFDFLVTLSNEFLGLCCYPEV